jgi:hypothetical protein
MALDFQAVRYNTDLVNTFNKAACEIDSLGALASLCNDYDFVEEMMDQAKSILMGVMESTIITDPEENEGEEQQIAPDEIVEKSPISILPTQIEVDGEDNQLRAIMYNDGVPWALTEWVPFEPNIDVTYSISSALRLMAEVLERKYDLSQLPKAEDNAQDPDPNCN